MRFEVPQFIDIKDKVIGPLSFVQALYLAGGLGGGYIALRVLPGFVGWVVGLVLAGIGASLAFATINGRPFPIMLYAILVHYSRPRLYLWRHSSMDHSDKKPSDLHTTEQQKQPITTEPRTIWTEQKVKDISWGLDVLEK